MKGVKDKQSDIRKWLDIESKSLPHSLNHIISICELKGRIGYSFKVLLRYNSYYIIHSFKVYNSLVFSVFTQLY